MAEEAAKPAPKKAEKTEKKKAVGGKAKPTNCVQCNVRIRRKTWYYRYGQYYCGKNCSSVWWTKNQETKQEARAKAAATAPETPAA